MGRDPGHIQIEQAFLCRAIASTRLLKRRASDGRSIHSLIHVDSDSLALHLVAPRVAAG